MNFGKLRIKNLTYFKRYYKLVAVAVLVMVAVVVGSLVVGDSVRNTLKKRVYERLGDTETIVFTGSSFLEKSILEQPLFQHNAEGVLLTDGFISSAGKLIPVTVWGTDNKDILKGSAKINQRLAKELSETAGSDIVLRLPAAGLVPSGSLFVTENYTTSLRLNLGGIVDVENGGNRNLKNEQALPFNVFVNYDELASALDIEGKINLIFSPKKISETDLNTAWDYSFSGLKTKKEKGKTTITSDRIFIQPEAVNAICKVNPNHNRLFSYLVNSIESGNKSIPYSFTTAVDTYEGKTLQKDEIILSDYAANRLNAKIGDNIQITYFTSNDLKTLSTDTLQVHVSQIVLLTELQSDSTLKADFPGFSNVESCTDWDSDLPVNMKLITKEDEDYWDAYRNTPKAIISYRAVADKWSNSYGNATGLIVDSENVDLNNLNAGMFGVQLIYPKQAGLYAAANGVDFSSLFMALGFFIILSAVLLMIVTLSEMLSQRTDEISLLKSLGFPRKRIVKLLWNESLPVVLFSSVVGVIAGFIYTFAVMFLLGNVWKGATHTEGFAVLPNMATVVIGLAIGIGLTLLILRIGIVRSLKRKEIVVKAPKSSLNKLFTFAALASIVVVFTVFLNLTFLKSSVVFILLGVIIIGTAALWGNYILFKNRQPAKNSFEQDKMIWATLFANRKQAILSFFTLAMGVFIVFSVGLNRRGFADSSQLLTGTGGYSLWCETSVPLYHNISTDLGREKLALKDLPKNAEVLQILRYNADDASCLNLNKVSNPSVLGIELEVLKNSNFGIEQSFYSSNEKEFIFEKLQHKTDSVYPVLVDATVLMWGLVMQLGDTLTYQKSNGENVKLLLAGTLKNSIFQGNVLMDKRLFAEIWDDIKGSQVMLVKVPDAETEITKMLILQALSNYGVKVTTTNDRLKEFYSVTDTYLTIFMTLGGLGLLLGIMSFIIVVRKSLASRRDEIYLYRSLGFTDERIKKTLYKENIFVPVYAIAVGVLASFIGISSGIQNVGLWIWILTIIFTILFVALVLVFVKKMIGLVIEDKNFN